MDLGVPGLVGGEELQLRGSEMLEWNPEAISPVEQVHAVTVAAASQVFGLQRRYLPHGHLHDLYWLFLGSWEVLQQAEAVRISQRLDVCPSWSSFRRRWHQLWKRLLRFRKVSQHAQCSTCFQLQRRMNEKSATWEVRMQAAADLKVHYQNQHLDRCIYWSLRFASRASCDVLTIIIDSMDKAKFAWWMPWL